MLDIWTQGPYACTSNNLTDLSPQPHKPFLNCQVQACRRLILPGLHRAGAAAGALALPNGTTGSAGWSHPLPLLGGFPHAAVPLSTRGDGEDGSPHEFSALECTLGISPQPDETGKEEGYEWNWGQTAIFQISWTFVTQHLHGAPAHFCWQWQEHFPRPTTPHSALAQRDLKRRHHILWSVLNCLLSTWLLLSQLWNLLIFLLNIFSKIWDWFPWYSILFILIKCSHSD